MSATWSQLAHAAASSSLTDDGLTTLGALTGGGIALAGGAIGAAKGIGTVGGATVTGIARQPEAQNRLYTTMFLIVGLCEAAYWINVAFMALFVFVIAGG